MDSHCTVTTDVEPSSQETIEPFSQKTTKAGSQDSQETTKPSSQDSRDLDYASSFHNMLRNWTTYADEKWTEQNPKAEDLDIDLSPIHQSPASSWADNDFSPVSTDLSFDQHSCNELSPATFASPVSSLASAFSAALLSPDPGPYATVSPADLSCASSPPHSPRSTLFRVDSRSMDYDSDDVQDLGLEDGLEYSDVDGDQSSECDELIDEDESDDNEPSAPNSRPLQLKNWNQTQASPSTSSSKRAHQSDSEDEFEQPMTKQKRTYGRGTKSSFRGRNKLGRLIYMESKSRNEVKLTPEQYSELLEEAKRKLPELPSCSIPGCKLRNKPLTRFQDWERHMKTHTSNVARPACSHCKKKFSRKDALARHINNSCNGLYKKVTTTNKDQE